LLAGEFESDDAASSIALKGLISNSKAPPAREAMEKRACVLLKVNGEEYRVEKEWWRDSVQGAWFCRPLLIGRWRVWSWATLRFKISQVSRQLKATKQKWNVFKNKRPSKVTRAHLCAIVQKSKR
jgi:hypothetical protein